MSSAGSTGRRSPRGSLALWGSVVALLATPLIAMRFTAEVAWTAGDFAFAAALLGGAALAWEVARRRLRRPSARLVAAGVILAAVLTVWAQAAVGVL